jgi:hypothetical protein
MGKTVTDRTYDNRIFSTLNFLFRNIFGDFCRNRKITFPEDYELLPKFGSVPVESK